MSPSSRSLGIIELENRPLRLPGAVGNADSFGFPVCYETAAGAWSERVVGGDMSLAPAYCDAARKLERKGVRAIITSCGFAVAYQDELAAAVDVPVASSSLLWLPWMLAVTRRSAPIAVLTFDGGALKPAHFRAAGVDAGMDRLRVYGVEGTPLWHDLRTPEPQASVADIELSVAGLIERAFSEATRPGAVLLECSAFGIVRRRISSMIDVPVFDLVSLSHALMASLDGSEELRG